MANLASLPTEVIIQILRCDDISQKGLKSLRLLCHRICGPATLALFSRICISKLKSDRESLFNIAAQPHLAQAVRTIVWFELAEDELSFVQLRNPRRRGYVRLRNSRSRSVFGSYQPHMLDEFIAQARGMFWLPFEDLNRYKDEPAEAANKRARAEARTEAIETFMPLFCAALDSMPNLATFVSQPIHPLRELAMSSGTPGYPMTAQIFQRGQYARKKQMNEGLCTFIIPYMLQRANSSKLSPITGLHFADEGTSSFMTRITPEFAESFTCLSRLDLCVSRIRTLKDFTELAQCLKAATNLTELRLCFERCQPPGGSDILDAVFLPTSQWPKLRHLHLDDVPIVAASLVRVVKGLVESLRILRFDYCPLTLKTLTCLAKIQGLKLQRFISTGKCPYDESKPKSRLLRGNYKYEEEKHVLQFLESNGSFWCLENRHEDCYIYTSVSAYDLCGWRIAALFHSRAVRYKYLNGQSSYSIAEMRELEREDENANAVQDDSSNEDEEDTGSASDSAEKASNEKRLLSAPRWNWQRGDHNEIYYWEITHLDEGQVCHPTELWRFTHRNGESALGDDPLEFWEDWEGSEAGDVYEATHLGKKFDDFLKNPWQHRVPKTPIPFERAVKWNKFRLDLV